MLRIIHYGVLETRHESPCERKREVPVFFSRRSKNICFRKLARQILKILNINMAAMSLKSFRDFIVLCYGTNIIDGLEFILFHDYSQCRGIYPYHQKYKQFYLEIFDEAQCVTEFRLQK